MELTELDIQAQSNPIGILSLVADYLTEQGFDPAVVFDQFNIKLADLKNNLMPISLHTQGCIFKAVEDLTQCEHLGLAIGKNAQLSNIGPLRFLVLNAATVRDAIQSLFHYGSMWYRGQKIDLIEDQGYAHIHILMDGDIPCKAQYQTAYLAAMVSIIGLVLGRAWRPTLVRIAYPKPKCAYLYESFFGCPVWFGQSQHEILFPLGQLDQKRDGHDQQLDNFLRQYLSELQSKIRNDFLGQVSDIIEELLPHSCCSIEKVAAYFSMHRFTLYRYLHKHQTTFESLLETTRKNVAIRLLSNPKLMIIDVANQVGYDDQANFTRAFKRWYGVSPGRWRRIQSENFSKSDQMTKLRNQLTN